MESRQFQPADSGAGAQHKNTTFSAGSYNSGYHARQGTLGTPSYDSLSFSGGVLTLTALAGAGQFASVIGNDQNTLSFSVLPTAVPEPETFALVLAGLVAVGSLARRRQG